MRHLVSGMNFLKNFASLSMMSACHWVMTRHETVCTEQQAYLDEVRDYMPPKHAIFIRALRNGPSILQFGEFTDSFTSWCNLSIIRLLLD